MGCEKERKWEAGAEGGFKREVGGVLYEIKMKPCEWKLKVNHAG